MVLECVDLDCKENDYEQQNQENGKDDKKLT